MRGDVYKRHIENFKNHWWFKGRKKIIEIILEKNKNKKKLDILDFGAGSGTNLKMLSKFGKVYIYEPHQSTKAFLKKNYKSKNFQVLKKITNKKFDIILLADVLEHLKNDKREIDKLSKNLKSKGKFLITVPAFQLLFTRKDTILGHYRRYNRGKLKNVFKNYKIIKLTYFNFFLFFPIAIVLLIFRILKIDFIDDVEKKPNNFFNSLLYSIFVFESKIINFINFPFGISIIGCFQRND